MNKQRWFLRLAQPLVMGMNAQGLDREEVIDTLVVEYLPTGSQCVPESDVIAFWKAIDWANSDPMKMEEFEACDLYGAVHQAQADARRRADAYADYMITGRDLGFDYSHRANMAHARLLRADEEASNDG